MSADRQPRTVGDASGGSVTFESVVELLADNVETTNNPTGLAPTAGRVSKDATTDEVYIADGDQWLDVNHDVGLDLAGLPGTQVVRSADDLPDASGGERVLEDGKGYLFADFIADPAVLRLPDDGTAPIFGWHGSTCGYIHTGGDVAVRGRGASFMMRDMYLHAPGGDVVDLQGDQTTEMLVESHSSSDAAGLGDAASLGTIDGMRVPTFKGCNFEDYNGGMEFDGTPDKIFLSECPLRSPGPSVQTFKLLSTCDVDIVDIAGCYGKDWQADTEFFHTEAGGEPSDVLQVRGTTFDGSVNVDNIITGALNESSVGVSVVSCWPLADSQPGASMSQEQGTDATVSFTAQDPGDGSEAMKIGGSTTAFDAVTDRFTHTSPNTLTYIGKRRHKDKATATVSVSGSNTTIAVYFAKNGTVLNRSAVRVTTASAGQPRAVTVASRLDLSTGDDIEIYIANEGGTGDIEVTTLEVII